MNASQNEIDPRISSLLREMDPESRKWAKRALSGIDPYGFRPFERSGVVVLSVIENGADGCISAQINGSGRIRWRCLNLEPRTRRTLELHATVARNRVRYLVGDVDRAVSNTEFRLHNIEVPDPAFGSGKTERTVAFELHEPGASWVKTTCKRKKDELLSRFEIVTQPMKQETSKKTIISIDLVGYSDIARPLEENISAVVTAMLGDQIRTFVMQGLIAASIDKSAVFAETGDGALLMVDTPASAHLCAEEIHKASAEHNILKNVASAKRWFRVGVATGDVVIRERDGAPRSIQGIAITNAVRLQSQASPGASLIDVATFTSLPDEFKGKYGPAETIQGKRDETFRAHRYVVIKSDPDKAEPSVEDVLQLFDQLAPRDQLLRLMLLVDMPVNVRPPETLTLGKRQDSILDWSVSRPNGLKHLFEKLMVLLQRDKRR